MKSMHFEIKKEQEETRETPDKHFLYNLCKQAIVMEPMTPSEYQDRIFKLAEALGI